MSLLASSYYKQQVENNMQEPTKKSSNSDSKSTPNASSNPSSSSTGSQTTPTPTPTPSSDSKSGSQPFSLFSISGSPKPSTGSGSDPESSSSSSSVVPQISSSPKPISSSTSGSQPFSLLSISGGSQSSVSSSPNLKPSSSGSSKPSTPKASSKSSPNPASPFSLFNPSKEPKLSPGSSSSSSSSSPKPGILKATSKSSSSDTLTSQEVGKRLAQALLDELRPTDFLEPSPSDFLKWIQEPCKVLPRDKLSFQKVGNEAIQKRKFSDEIADDPTSSNQNLFCIGHTGFMRRGAEMHIEHADPYAEVRKNQEQLLKYLNENQAVREAFLSFQPVSSGSPIMEPYFIYDKDGKVGTKGALVGTKYFYRQSYNAMRNLYLLCGSCNLSKTDKNPLQWIDSLSLFQGFREYYRKEHGDFQKGLLFLRAYKGSTATQLTYTGNNDIFLPPSNAPGLGEAMRQWLITVHAGVFRVYREDYNKGFKTLKTQLGSFQQSVVDGMIDEDEEKVKKVRKYLEKVSQKVGFGAMLTEKLIDSIAQNMTVEGLAPATSSLPSGAASSSENLSSSSSSSDDDTLSRKKLDDNLILQTQLTDRAMYFIRHIARKIKRHFKEPSFRQEIVEYCLILDQERPLRNDDGWLNVYNGLDFFLAQKKPNLEDVKGFIRIAWNHFAEQAGLYSKGTIEEKNKKLEEREAELQEKDVVIQEKETELQEKDESLQLLISLLTPEQKALLQQKKPNLASISLSPKLGFTSSPNFPSPMSAPSGNLASPSSAHATLFTKKHSSSTPIELLDSTPSKISKTDEETNVKADPSIAVAPKTSDVAMEEAKSATPLSSSSSPSLPGSSG